MGFTHHVGHHRPDAAELGVSKGILGSGFGRNPAICVGRPLGHDDHAIAVVVDTVFDLGQKGRLVERDLRGTG